MRHFLILSCLSLSFALSAGPVEDLLTSRNIHLAPTKVFKISKGTALPIKMCTAHPLTTLHGTDQVGLSLTCDLYVRGGDFYVSIDQTNWMPFEEAVARVFPGAAVSVAGNMIVVTLPA